MRRSFTDRDAYISADGAYRYWLTRRVSRGGDSFVLFVGTNPSTADALKDDPTIGRCFDFARSWEYNWLLMANLHAYRATNPKELSKVGDPVGPENKEALEWLVRKADMVVAAWGRTPLTAESRRTAAWIMSLSFTQFFDVNKNGEPKHPLYLPKTAQLRRHV